MMNKTVLKETELENVAGGNHFDKKNFGNAGKGLADRIDKYLDSGKYEFHQTESREF